eukprot:CAMPEP_0202379352 /NCGR_PEP_ID=MMETSP1127-20130417/23787_1 /ASSEMBLY_ACC=CAM_ASM_000462 /TAXON_ID=3047 /ORGANISM="Dunaliella tertiolecta, Strain CCMP1320" /LENGTH=396 /DNA_ID=CAMNT_0048977845 /DNA_START=16 /DNA_END=1206 /DNA_ORIENTATION=-
MSAEYADLDIVQLTYDQDMRQETADDNEHASALIPVVDWPDQLEDMARQIEYQNNLPAQYLGQQASFTPVPGSLPPTPMHSYLRPPAPSASDDESQLFFNRYLHASSAQSIEAVMHAPPPPLEERGPANEAALLESQQLIQHLLLAERDTRSIAYEAVIKSLQDELVQTHQTQQSLRQELTQRDSQILARDARIQELQNMPQVQQNQNGTPSWQDAQTSLRVALGNGNNGFMLTANTLKHLVRQPVQALQVCKALGKIPARERDVLTHHMQFFYGPSFAKADPNYYTDNTWNTWYGYLWRLLRWIGAYAARTGSTVDDAAHQIQHLAARYDNNEVISFENWNRKEVYSRREQELKASSRLHGDFLEAWNVAGQSVNVGYRQLDRIEQFVQGCNVQV